VAFATGAAERLVRVAEPAVEVTVGVYEGAGDAAGSGVGADVDPLDGNASGLGWLETRVCGR
jgi:hypothetical protein